MGPSSTATSIFLLPHGGYSLIPTVLTTCAWVASIFQDGCDYAIIEGPIVQTITNDEDDTGADTIPWLEVGFAAFRRPDYNRDKDIWEISYTGRCTDYNEDRMEFDPAWKAAKAFAFLALILGGGGALFLWFSACCVFSKATWRWAGYEVLLAATFQGMSFLWFANSMCTNKNICKLSWGSKTDVVSFVMWIMAAMAIFYKYPAPNLSNHPDERHRLTTRPEILVTGMDSSSQSQKSKKSPSPNKVQSPSQISAALPLEGDAGATMSAKHRGGGGSKRIKPRHLDDQDYAAIVNERRDLENVQVI